MVWSRPRYPPFSSGMVGHPTGVMEHPAHRHAAPASSARAASMSSTTNCKPCVDPGAADATPAPKMTEHLEPGGVICTTRKPPSPAKSASSRHPSAFPERLEQAAGEGIDVFFDNVGGRQLTFALSVMKTMAASCRAVG